MDILIKNIELPKDGFTRMMLWSDGGVAIEVNPNNYEQLDDNVIELPPHGRLIDVEILKETLMKSAYPEQREWYFAEACQFIDEAPTVLEASNE